MTIQWNKNWDRVDAVLNLCFDGSKANLDGNIASRLRISVTEAFDGLPARLSNDADLGKQGEVLAESIVKIKNTMITLKLEATKELHAILWIRLLNQVGIKITDPAISLFGRWMIEQGTKNILLMQYQKSESDTWRGSRIEIDGSKDRLGFTILEMLFLRKENTHGWPFNFTWRMKPQEKVTKGNTSSVNPAQPAAKEIQRSSSAKTVTQKPARKKRRTLEEIKKSCGEGLVNELQRCIRKEAKKVGSSLLGILGKDKRYASSHSLDKLIIRLQNQYQTLKKLKASTLKSALSAFVSCPRGRPPSKIKAKEQGIKRPIRR